MRWVDVVDTGQIVDTWQHVELLCVWPKYWHRQLTLMCQINSTVLLTERLRPPPQSFSVCLTPSFLVRDIWGHLTNLPPASLDVSFSFFFFALKHIQSICQKHFFVISKDCYFSALPRCIIVGQLSHNFNWPTIRFFFFIFETHKFREQLSRLPLL